MRSRILPVAGVSALALVAAASFAPMASAGGHNASPAGKAPVGSLFHYKVNPLASCYAQTANDTGAGPVSQNFAKADNIYDSQGADDFKLKKTCKAKTVSVNGVYFNGTGPADSVNVTFYKNKKNKPGDVIATSKNSSYTDNSGTGDFKIKLEKTVTLKSGTYWVSVQANMDFAAGGEWAWLTNSKVKNNGAKWQNPDDGFATGCTKYKDLLTCIPDVGGGDLAFSISS